VVVSPASAVTLRLTAPGTATAGSAFTVTVTAVDAYGNVATGYTGTVQFTSSDGGATLPGNFTFTAGDAGAHSFASGVTLTRAGAQTVSAADSQNSSVGGSATVQVGAAAAASLAVTAPGTVTAGAAFGVTLTALDSYGNTATGYTGAVHFTSSDGQATLPTDYTFTAADAGLHAFGTTLRTAASQSITATDTATASITGTQGGILVPPAAAVRLRVSGTTSGTAGAALSYTVTALDPYGNVATGYTGAVHFTSSDGQATLPIDYTFTAADQGVHSVSVTFRTAGSQSLTAADTATASITGTQGNIAVGAAAASSLLVTGFPATTAGLAHTFTVTARDAYGNVATGYTGAVQFTSSDGQATLPADYTFTAGDAGTHTFSATLKTAGSQSLTATDRATATITGKQSGILVTAAAATHLSIAAPSQVSAGVAFSVVVTALDAYGNVATGYRGTLRFASTDRKAGLPANYTFAAADNGVHTFSVSLSTRGVQSIIAQDTANGSITGRADVNVARG
jgi:hypothetical protein